MVPRRAREPWKSRAGHAPGARSAPAVVRAVRRPGILARGYDQSYKTIPERFCVFRFRYPYAVFMRARRRDGCGPREPRGARGRVARATGRAQAVLRLTLSAVYVGLTAAARQTRLDPDGTRSAVARDAARDDAG